MALDAPLYSKQVCVWCVLRGWGVRAERKRRDVCAVAGGRGRATAAADDSVVSSMRSSVRVCVCV